MTTVFEFDVSDASGNKVSLANYEGKVLLVVNVASKCGLTPQYEGLEQLQRTYKDQVFEVLGFPCNQFLGQEPGSDNEIQEFCKITYGVTFPVFGKVDVNGPDAAPLYQHLRTEAAGDFGPQYGDFYTTISQIVPDAKPNDVKWNFTKFLVARDGSVVKRYESPVAPDVISQELGPYLAHDEGSAGPVQL